MLNLHLIVAISKNYVIGYQNKLPWHLSQDLKHFKQTTLNQHVLMGKNTFLSIFSYLNKPLPQRTNIVISSTLNAQDYVQFNNVKIYKNLRELYQAYTNFNEIIYVIGGAEIYTQTLPHASKLIVSHVEIECDGDAFFPVIDKTLWHIESKIKMDDIHPFTIVTYTR
jgi:dihydrofolate reductase